MAKLKPCKTCGKEVAKSAKKCPHCGQKLKMGFFMKALIGIAALIVIGIIASSGGGDDSTKTASSTPSSSTPAKKEAAKPLTNEGVSSDVTIKVVGIESKPEVGNEYTKKKAQGVFKIVEVSINNNQKDAITLDANSFKLVDAQGREFTYSSDGQIAFDVGENEGNSNFFLKQLNPGLTQTGKIIFDLPADAKGLTLKARGGMTGEEITLKAE
jgi:hypothetical protein